MSRHPLLRPGRALLAATWLGAGAAAAGAAEPEARIELRPELVAVDETVVLTLEVTVEGGAGARFEPNFELENLSRLSGPSATRMHQWVDGRATSGTRLAWRLRPREPGGAAVRSVRLRVDDREIRLPDREIRVVSAAERPPRPPRRRLDPFDALLGEDPFAPFRRSEPATLPKLRLSAEVSAPRAWVGEQLVWQLMLDTQTDVSAFRPRLLPDFEGFWVRELPVPESTRPEPVRFDDEPYWRVARLRRALFPLRAGRFRLGPARADVVARIAEVGWAGPIARNRPLALEANPVEIEVLPLPEAPAKFSGAIGELALSARIEPARVPVGTAATLTVTVIGPGNLSAIPPPRLDRPKGLRVFEPGSASAEEPDRGRLRTTLTWSWVVVGERPGRFTLRLPEVTWFDPAAGRFRTSSLEPIALEVSAGSKTAGRDLPGAAEAEEPERASFSPAAAGGILASGLALVLGAWAAVAAHRRSRPAREARTRLARKLAEARRKSEPTAAATALEAAWREWLAARWDLGGGLAVSHWPERLSRAGLAPKAAAAIVELFRELHDLRYAPELSDVGSLLREAHETSDRLFRDLA